MIITKTLSITQGILSLTLLLLYPALSSSTEYYVDGTTGHDADDGSASTPWKTIITMPIRLAQVRLVPLDSTMSVRFRKSPCR